MIARRNPLEDGAEGVKTMRALLVGAALLLLVAASALARYSELDALYTDSPAGDAGTALERIGDGLSLARE